MKRTAGEYAVLLGLLDQALDLPEDARGSWIEQLSEDYSDLRPTLRRMLSAESLLESEQALNLFEKVAAVGMEAAAQAAPRTPMAGDRVGPYRLDREVGQGGMGSVWLAERVDGAFKRSVALKLPFAAWSGRLHELMVRERDILAGLEHPNIARFYDAGVDEMGRPYLAMEYVEGRSIDAYCTDQSLSIEERIGLVLEVAKGISFAHSKLVVHRDLKPGNILVTAQGQVRLLDFGVAKLIAGEASPGGAALTEVFGRAMTPDYASPEQITGQPVGTQSDMYSLAVMTYELLTGYRPYKLKRGSAAELERAIAEVDPPLASSTANDPAVKRRLRGDLDAILNMGMKKNPAERYATVDAFAADLTRFLRGEPVLAQPDTARYRFNKFVARHRIGISAGAVIACALIAATSVSIVQAGRATRQAEAANAMKNFLLQLFTAGDNRLIGSKPPSQITALELLDKGSSDLMGSLNTEPAAKLELMRTMAGIYEQLDAQDKARSLLQSGADFAVEKLGPNSPEQAHFLGQEANSYFLSGKWPEADSAVEKAEQAFIRSGDIRSLDYAQILKLKGQLLRRHGPAGINEARVVLEKSASLFARDFPNDPGYVGALMYLSGTLMSLDDLPGAKAKADLAVERASASKEDDSEWANALGQRAGIKSQMGDLAGAAQDMGEASKIFAASVGLDHYLYLQNEGSRGQVLHLAGQRDEGLQLVESTTNTLRKTRPDSNTLANGLVRNIAVYLSDGAYAEAYGAAEEALKLKTAQQQVALHVRLLLDQASAMIGMGKFDAALKNLEQATQDKNASGPLTATDQADLALFAARIAYAMGNFTEARQQAGLAKDKAVGDTRRIRSQRTKAMVETARAALALHDMPAALSAAQAARDLIEAPDLRTEVFPYANVLFTQANVLCSSGNVQEGLPLAEQVLARRQSAQRAGSPLLAEAQLLVARCAIGAEQVERARTLVQSAESILANAPWAGPQFQTALSTTSAMLPQS
jgi:eukaryotic-like serine/threonine-protein kinase